MKRIPRRQILCDNMRAFKYKKSEEFPCLVNASYSMLDEKSWNCPSIHIFDKVDYVDNFTNNH